MTVQEVYLQKVQVTKQDGVVVGTPKVLAEWLINENCWLSYTFPKIENGGRIYNLHNPLRCKLEQDEDNVYLIQHELLDIVGAGDTEAEAIKSFQEEFDEAYYSYNQYKDAQLAPHLLRAKNFINLIVKK